MNLIKDNNDVCWAVGDAVYDTVFGVLHCSVNEAVDDAGYWAVDRNVYGSLCWSLYRPVHHAVHRDVYEATRIALKDQR